MANDITLADILKADMAMDAAQQEAYAEMEAAVVLRETTYQDIFSPKYRQHARSVAAQFNKWTESEEAPSDEAMCLCVDANKNVNGFRDHVIGKYQKNPKELLKWQTLFSDAGFLHDVKRFIWQKTFEAKGRLQDRGVRAFRTQIGLEHWVRQKWEKLERGYVHEARGRAFKIAQSNPDMRAQQVADVVVETMLPMFRDLRDSIARDLAANHAVESRQPRGFIASAN